MSSTSRPRVLDCGQRAPCRRFSAILRTMTDDDDKLADVLRIYAEHPMRDGDVVLLLDDRVCFEVEGLAVHWAAVLRRNTANVVRETARRVVVCIARRHRKLRDSDYQLWRDLHSDLSDSDVHLLPVRALPAA